jgi:CO dehydrogenase maturation factor
MRIALVGKGGSGKTTTAALLARLLAARGKHPLVLDADINQHMAAALGLTDLPPELGNSLTEIKTILRGSNSRIATVGQMVKTTPPGSGSHLIDPANPADPVLNRFSVHDQGVRFMRVGGFTEADLGTKCFHAKTGAVELILNHLADAPHHHTVVDMTAGADAFASGLFTRFDLTVLVVEPTEKSLSVYRQYKEYAQGHTLTLRAVGNKVQDAEDIAYLQQACGDDLLGWFVQSDWVRKAERGTPLPLTALEAHNLATLNTLVAALEGTRRDWRTYWAQGVHFHALNGKSWANQAAGCDVTTQVDMPFLESFAARVSQAPA